MIFDMKIVFIRAARTKGYLTIRLTDGEENIDFTVSERDYADAGSPCVADSLTRDALSALKLADMRYRARLKASRVLAYGDNSERMLVVKLVRAGISKEIAEETAREMVMRGYVNNVRQLERLIVNEVARLSGPRKFIPKLIAKGYSRSDIDIALDELIARGEIDLGSAREALIKKYGAPSCEERCAILYKHGFSDY